MNVQPLHMPTLVDFTGDGDIYPSRLCSMGSHADVYVPTHKRPRFEAPYAFESFEFPLHEQPSMDLLPDECLSDIFSRLSGKKERSACACVSKRWLMILTTTPSHVSKDNDNEGFLTRSLEGDKASDVRLAAIVVGTSFNGGLGKLSIRGSSSPHCITDLGVSIIANGCPSLRQLSLWNIATVGDSSIIEISKRCPMLEKLELCNCPSVSDKALEAVARNSRSLSFLCIESCPLVSNEGLQSFGKLSTKLSSISIKDCRSIGDQGVSSLISSPLSALCRVKLQCLNITDFSLAVIGHYGKSITSLVLGNLNHVSEKGFWVMGKAQGLHGLLSLKVNSCSGFTDLSLNAIVKGCPNLKQLCLRHCPLLSDNGLLALSKATSIESLQLEECNKITQSGVFITLTSCCSTLKALSLVKCLGIRDERIGITESSSSKSSLCSLSIRNCPGFGNSTLAELAKLCQQLQYLDLSGLCGVTDAGILPIIEGSEAGLVKVNTSGCFNITDDVVSSVSRRHGGTLEVLNFDGCMKVTDASMAAIAENCLFLRDLDLSKCAVTDKGLSLLSSSEQLNLQILSLSGCLEVTNSSLPNLKKMGRTLVGLNLRKCGFGSGTAQILVECLWRCDILL